MDVLKMYGRPQRPHMYGQISVLHHWRDTLQSLQLSCCTGKQNAQGGLLVSTMLIYIWCLQKRHMLLTGGYNALVTQFYCKEKKTSTSKQPTAIGTGYFAHLISKLAVAVASSCCCSARIQKWSGSGKRKKVTKENKMTVVFK